MLGMAGHRGNGVNVGGARKRYIRLGGRDVVNDCLAVDDDLIRVPLQQPDAALDHRPAGP